MARPIKNGIDYFPLDVDIFTDEKMVPISVEYGIKGEIIAIRLLCAIYRGGYFAEWNDAMRYKLSKEMPSVSTELLDSVVSRMVKWGFFNRELFKHHNVLTSEGIQRRYFAAIRRRKNYNTVGLPFLLVNREDIQHTTLSHERKKPQTFLRPTAPRKDTTGSNAEWLKEFFDDRNKENLLLLCKNLSLGYGKIDTLRSLADAVIAEWELSDTAHRDYSDWSRHLISTIRIKSRGVRPDKPGDNKNATPPASDDYTYGGGFGGQDT